MGWMTAVLDDALGLPCAAGKKDITETWEVCASTFLFFPFLSCTVFCDHCCTVRTV